MLAAFNMLSSGGLLVYALAPFVKYSGKFFVLPMSEFLISLFVLEEVPT